MSGMSPIITASRAGEIVLRGGDGDHLVEFSTIAGHVVAWVDNEGGYHRVGGEPSLFVERVPKRDEIDAAYARSIIASMPLPPRGFRTSDGVALSAAGAILLFALVVVGGWFGWRRIAAQMLTRPLRRLGKWLDRGPRSHEAEVLRFKRDLNRTVEQLESARGGGR